MEIRFLPDADLRELFDAERILEGVDRGHLYFLVETEELAHPRSGQPVGTMSQTLRYYSGTEWVADAHRFVHPDDAVGASGLPDPKAVLHEGIWWILKPELS